MFKSVLYWFLAAIAMTIYGMQRLNFPLPSLINNYVNDLLCFPLVLGAITFIIRKLKKDNHFTFSIYFVLFLVAYYSVYFEYYLPIVNTRYTADWIDVLLYFIGGISFYFFEKRTKVVPQHE